MQAYVIKIMEFLAYGSNTYLYTAVQNPPNLSNTVILDKIFTTSVPLSW